MAASSENFPAVIGNGIAMSKPNANFFTVPRLIEFHSCGILRALRDEHTAYTPKSYRDKLQRQWYIKDGHADRERGAVCRQ